MKDPSEIVAAVEGAEILEFRPKGSCVEKADGGRRKRKQPLGGVPLPPDDPPPAPPAGGGEDDGRPIITIVPGELDRMTREAEDALAADPPAIFQRGAALVRPDMISAEFAGQLEGFAPALHVQSPVGVYRVLAERTRWEKFDGRVGRMVRRDPPKDVANMLAAGVGQWRLARISGVTSCPTMRPDGSLLMLSGYDPATGLYSFWQGGDLRMPLAPTRFDAEEALGDLRHVLREFPFVDDVDRAVAFSAVLTVVGRGALRVAPMHGVTAPVPGSGKSFFVDLCAVLATGRPCPVISASEDDAETEKRLVSAVLSGFSVISLDNVNRQLRSDLLSQAVEREVIHLRPLGSSAAIEVANRSTFFGTGNGFSVAGDLVRRTLICRLDPRMERPETREFEDDPVAVVLADRHRYLRAALVILQAYRLSGDNVDLPPVGSFADWSSTVRSALVWLGLPDPAKAIETSRENDAGLRALGSILTFLHQAFGVEAFSVTSIIALIGRASGDDVDMLEPHAPSLPEDDRADFREILLSIAGARGIVNGRRLSIWLSHNEGRCLGGKRIEKTDPDKKAKVLRWRIVEF